VKGTAVQSSLSDVRERFQRTLELAGAKGLRPTHSPCVHRGDTVRRFEGTWD